jgi:hypothetical protein
VLNGTVTYNEGDEVLDTTTSPGTPVVLQRSALGVGSDTVTVTYDVWLSVAFAQYSVNVPVTVTSS